MAFQHGNQQAGVFWRRVADAASGPGQGHEDLHEAPGPPGVPPGHWIETR